MVISISLYFYFSVFIKSKTIEYTYLKYNCKASNKISGRKTKIFIEKQFSKFKNLTTILHNYIYKMPLVYP